MLDLRNPGLPGEPGTSPKGRASQFKKAMNSSVFDDGDGITVCFEVVVTP